MKQQRPKRCANQKQEKHNSSRPKYHYMSIPSVYSLESYVARWPIWLLRRSCDVLRWRDRATEWAEWRCPWTSPVRLAGRRPAVSHVDPASWNELCATYTAPSAERFCTHRYTDPFTSQFYFIFVLIAIQYPPASIDAGHVNDKLD